MDMVERVARALAGLSLEAQGNDKPVSTDYIIDRRWHNFVPQARVAIEAMETPTDAMLGIGTRWMMFEPSRASGDLVRSGYSAMIKAALS